MRGNAIAIVDSGFDSNNTFLKKNVVGGIEISPDGTIIENAAFHDENGHGTCCCSIIRDIVPGVRIYVIKILNQYNQGSSLGLIGALRYVASIDEIRIINLSLATVDKYYQKEMERVCEELTLQGKIIISSLGNGMLESFPASFHNVIGVRGNNFFYSHDYWFNERYSIQGVADCNPTLVKKSPSNFSVISGNSKAAILFSGIVLKQIEECKIHSISDLERFSKRSEWNEMDIHENELLSKKIIEDYKSVKVEEDDVELMEKIVQIIQESFGTDIITKQAYKHNFLQHQFPFSIHKLYRALCIIEEEFQFDFCVSPIPLYDVLDVYSILAVVKRMQSRRQLEKNDWNAFHGRITNKTI